MNNILHSRIEAPKSEDMQDDILMIVDKEGGQFLAVASLNSVREHGLPSECGQWAYGSEVITLLKTAPWQDEQLFKEESK